MMKINTVKQMNFPWDSKSYITYAINVFRPRETILKGINDTDILTYVIFFIDLGLLTFRHSACII
jgi:hypothetical protein